MKSSPAAKAYKNPNADSANDLQVFVDAWKRSEFLGGDYSEEVRGEDGSVLEGPADIQVGLNTGYRVAWGTAMGNRETKRGTIFPNPITLEWRPHDGPPVSGPRDLLLEQESGQRLVTPPPGYRADGACSPGGCSAGEHGRVCDSAVRARSGSGGAQGE